VLLPSQGDHKSALRLYRQSYQYLSWTTFKHRTSDGDCELTYDEQVGWGRTTALLFGWRGGGGGGMGVGVSGGGGGGGGGVNINKVLPCHEPHSIT
jgi:hypothetical protein